MCSLPEGSSWFIQENQPSKLLSPTVLAACMNDTYILYCLFQKHLKTSKERHFFQVLCGWKIYDPICVADAVRIACLASALVWKWGWEWLPLGVPVTPQPCLTSSLCWLSQFLWSGLECVLGAGTDCYPRYNVVNFMLYSSLCGS